ncbi:MAG: hypothetical protein CSA62_03275 [Planctomycetota bacterium]|nr:MAG: hypothetical protein CSA62_03275 [Planctomycetota bacterium]
MHSAVLQNKGYIKFASRNTIEVITCSGIERAVKEQHRNAKTYEAMQGGKKKQFFVHFPGLDLAALKALNKSKARSYNNTGAIPHTSVVDPFTLESLVSRKGGCSARKLQRLIEGAADQIRKQHGKSAMDRGKLKDIAKAVLDAEAALSKEDIKKALSYLNKMAKKAAKWPEQAKTPLEVTRKRVLAFAEKKVDAALAMIDKKPREAMTLLRILQAKVRGTSLEERIKKALASH